MKRGLSKSETARILRKLKESAPLEECLTCECFQGLIAQLEVDAPFDISELAASLQVADSDLHKCLGCDPCPPADVYTEYLIEKNKQQAPGPDEARTQDTD